MPNGVDVPGVGIPIPIPQIGPSFADVGTAVGGFFGRVFGGAFQSTGIETEPGGVSRAIGGILAQAGFRFTGMGFGVEPIPTPAQGGPPLVTERFADLPGPFVREPDIPILQELGIPFPEPLLAQPILPQPIPFRRAIPEPDVLEEEEMPVDAPLLTASFLPALRQATTPAVTGFLGGLAQDVVSGLFARAPQEIGLGQVPARAPAIGGRLCPPERPSTRILRQIQAATGVRVKLSAAKAMARQLGLQNAARCLGLTITEVCTLIITPSPRRRRGISGSDIRIVKRTARRFQSLQEDLTGLVSRRRAAPRRRRHVHAIQHTAPAP